MPAVADLPPKPPIVHVVSADALGDEGRLVHRVAEQAAKHWQDRAECLLKEVPSRVAEFDYEPVPLKKVGTVTVHCKFVGPIEPMPYEWDE